MYKLSLGSVVHNAQPFIIMKYRYFDRFLTVYQKENSQVYKLIASISFLSYQIQDLLMTLLISIPAIHGMPYMDILAAH